MNKAYPGIGDRRARNPHFPGGEALRSDALNIDRGAGHYLYCSALTTIIAKIVPACRVRAFRRLTAV